MIRRLVPFVLLALLLGFLGCGEKGPPPNIVLFVIDTVRADHLSSYGYHRPTTPRIDALAADGTLFEEASSTAPYTRPSTATILTGQYPAVHGAITHADSLSPQVVTLAERLKERGYQTAGIYRNGNVSATFGFDRGFDLYLQPDKDYIRGRRKDPNQEPVRYVSETDDSLLTERALPFLDAEAKPPFFLYLHLGGAHDPYAPPPSAPSFLEEPLTPTAELFYRQPLKGFRTEPPLLRRIDFGLTLADERTRHQMVALYDGELAFADQQVGRVLDAIERLPFGDNTVVVVTADHGEEFWDHGGLGHGHTNFEEQLHVPLVMAGPGIRTRRVAEPVSLIDLVPTLLDLVGAEKAEELPGKSLLPVLQGRAASPEETLYAEGLLNLGGNGDAVFYRSLRRGDQKLILDFEHHRKQLFDLGQDPSEQDNLLGTPEGTAGRQLLEDLLATHDRNLASPVLAPVEAVEIDEELDQNLRALGYLGSSGDTEATTDLFRRPLRRFDYEPWGFVGHEVEGGSYLSALDFSTADFPEEQLLYGWGRQGNGTHRGIVAHAGARLARQPEHKILRLRGNLARFEGLLDPVGVEVRLDGVVVIRESLSFGAPFDLVAELPEPASSFARVDVVCTQNFSPEYEGRRNGTAPCAAFRWLGLE